LSGDVWLFGYGSLIWRPDVAFDERVPAVLHGYERRFWQRSGDHRGTADFMGRVVTLVPKEGARVVGVAYRLTEPGPTLERVDVREQQGYARLVLPVERVGGGALDAVVYVADQANPYFAGDEALEATAQVVAKARGPSGANLDYARSLVVALGELAAMHAELLSLEDFRYERELLALAEAQLELVASVGQSNSLDRGDGLGCRE
jgi:glutathione-specific gamma-glutamylcyclotransferase